MESIPYDLQKYLERLGPDAPVKTFAAFAAAVAADDPFGPNGVLRNIAQDKVFQACLADPSQPPDMSGFAAAREAYRETLDAVMDAHRLDALVFPQMREALPPLFGADPIRETTVSEINIAGLPGVVVPAGYHESGAPFCLIFVGRPWSEADLLGYAFDYEQATRHRRAPALK